VDSKDNKGVSALMRASSFGHEGTARVLLEAELRLDE